MNRDKPLLNNPRASCSLGIRQIQSAVNSARDVTQILS
jgi:hypothetical protein